MWAGGLGNALAGMASGLRLSAQAQQQLQQQQNQQQNQQQGRQQQQLSEEDSDTASGAGSQGLSNPPPPSTSRSLRARVEDFVKDATAQGRHGDSLQNLAKAILDENVEKPVAQDALLNALEQSWCDNRLSFSLVAMERAMVLCKWIATGAQDPEVAGQQLQEKFGSSWPRCNRVWLSNHVAYRCKDCGTTESSCICVECFDPAEHEGHDFRIYKSNSGGCCDCGDPNAWRPEGNCKAHRATSSAVDETNADLGSAVRRGAELVASVFVRELLLCICDVLRAISSQDPVVSLQALPPSSPSPPPDGTDVADSDSSGQSQDWPSFAAPPRGRSSSHVDHNASWRSQPNLMGASLAHLDILERLNTNGVQHFGVCRDMYVEKRERLFSEMIRFLTELCELGPPLRRLIAEELVGSSAAGQRRNTSGASAHASRGPPRDDICIASFIRFGVYLQAPAQQSLGILVLRLLIDDDFKARYTNAFVQNYGYLIVNYLHGEKSVRESINEYLDRILCQLCNSAEQVRQLVTGCDTDMLGVTVEAIYELGQRSASPRRFDVIELPAGMQTPSSPLLGAGHRHPFPSAASSSSSASPDTPRRLRTLGPDGGFPPVSSAAPGSNNSIVDVSSKAVEARLFYRPIMDLRLLLVHDSVVQHAVLNRPGILDQALGIFSLLQEINPQTRKVDVHTEYEQRGIWESAFLLEMEMICAFFRLVDGFRQVLQDKNAPRPRALNALRSSTRALANWLQGQGLVARRFVTLSTSQAKGGDPFAGVVASLTHIVSSGSYATSIHIPLHRFWAGIFHAAVEESEERVTLRQVLETGNGRPPSPPSGYMGISDVLDRLIAQAEDASTDEEDLTPPGFACLVAEHPLRVLSKVAQIRARAWVRNGVLVELEPQQYLSRSWVWYGYDLDLFTLQYAASVMDGDSFFRWVAKRFEVDEVLSYASAARFSLEDDGSGSGRRKSRRQRRAESEKLDDDQLASVCEAMLNLMSVLAHDRTRLGERPTETLRKQVVHALASSRGGKRTFSSIEACIPPRVLEEGGRLEDVLAEIADFNPPSVKDVEGTFSLKEPYWSADLDLYFSHSSAEERQIMEENFDLFHKRKRKRRDISSSLDSLPEGEALALREAASSPSVDAAGAAHASSPHLRVTSSFTSANASAPGPMNVARLMTPSLDAPIFKSFSSLPFNILFNAELHGAIFRILHACVRDESADAILARPGVLLEALSLLHQGVRLSAHLDIVSIYERELASQMQGASGATSMRGGASGSTSPLVGNKPRSRSCDGTIAWSWASAELQRCMSAPVDLRAMSMSINHRIDHVQHRVRLPFSNPVLNACELVPLADSGIDECDLDDDDGNNHHDDDHMSGARSARAYGRAHAASGSAADWSWPAPDRWGRDVQDLATALVNDITEHMQQLAPGLRVLVEHFTSSPRSPFPSGRGSKLGAMRTASSTSPSGAQSSDAGKLSSPDVSDTGSVAAEDSSITEALTPTSTLTTKKRKKKKKKKTGTEDSRASCGSASSVGSGGASQKADDADPGSIAARQARIMAKFAKRQATFLSSAKTQGLELDDVDVGNSSSGNGALSGEKHQATTPLTRDFAAGSRGVPGSGLQAPNAPESANDILDANLAEYRCPICRGLANTALLLFPADEMSSSSALQAEDDQEQKIWQRNVRNYLRSITGNFRSFAPTVDLWDIGRLFHENSLMTICTANEDTNTSMFQAFETLAYLSQSLSRGMRHIMADVEHLQSSAERIQKKLRLSSPQDFAQCPMNLLCSLMLLYADQDPSEAGSQALAASLAQMIVALGLEGASRNEDTPDAAIKDREALATAPTGANDTSDTRGHLSLEHFVQDACRRLCAMNASAGSRKIEAGDAVKHGLASLAARVKYVSGVAPSDAASKLCASFVQVFIIAREALKLRDYGAIGRQQWASVRETLRAVESGSVDLAGLGLCVTDHMIRTKVDQILNGLAEVLANEHVCKDVLRKEVECVFSAYIVVNDTRMMDFGSIFLDAHGEADPLLRRGKPLFASDARLRQLRRLVCGLGFTTEMAGMRRISHFIVETRHPVQEVVETAENFP
ncbi:E3 ubiquitin-protein ligase UBR3 [Hondaea fermentalgiana]|uniref:E3 ubiquitin-protein ligase n=1 Tax=Hondaea fermentalgiana TaxID=2315210 RepID=A0A2R5GDT9_9STRA|nr:E3 ubiquitin-protein ligase UBR3 [Hondaea fermentalgiana]|eukprot:GBG25964.1 E3 ubiquitin-protein ligase UBR3 [Hondaea fermentalgiana]